MKGGGETWTELVDHNNLSYRSRFFNLDMAYSKLNEYKKRKNEAIEIIKGTYLNADLNNQCVSCSFGKDSLVLLHLVTTFYPNIKIMFVNQGTEYPETLAAYEYYSKKHNVIKVNAEIPADEYYLRREKEDINFHNVIFGNPIKKFDKEYDIKLKYIGLRKKESKTRHICLCKIGSVHFAEYEKIFHVNPLLNWSGQDIWSYIAENNIIYPSLYDKDKFSNRDKLRNCPYGVFHGWSTGKLLHLKYYYPSLYHKFQKHYDKAGCYV